MSRAPPQQQHMPLHQSERPSMMYLMDDTGRIMSPEERSERLWRAGMCQKCGKVKTHKISRWGLRREPKTVPGIVYRGNCLRCNPHIPSDIEGGNREDTASRRNSDKPRVRSDNEYRLCDFVPSNIEGSNGDFVPSDINGSNHEDTASRQNSDKPRVRSGNEYRLGGFDRYRRMGSSGEGEGEMSVGEGGRRTHFANSQEQIGVRHLVVSPGMRSVSEISIDSSIMATHTRIAGSEDSLENIAEDEEPWVKGVSSCQTQDQDCNVSFGNASHARSHSGSSTRSPSSGSTNKLAADMIFTANGGCSPDSLLRRKLAADRGERRASIDGAGVTRSSGQQADNLDSSQKHTVTPGAQNVNDGGVYEKLLKRKIRTSTNDKQKSDSHHSVSESEARSGAQCVNDNDGGVYEKLMKRKIQTSTNDHKQKSDSHHRTGGADDSMSESEARTMISNSSCCSDLMDILKRSSSLNQAVLLKTLAKLRDCLLAAHGVDEESSTYSESLGYSKMAFPTSEWVIIFVVVMSNHSSNAIVQAELIVTLWSILTLHKWDTTDENAEIMKQIITAMETHDKEEPIQAYGCGLISCIAGASQKHALWLLGMCDEKCIHRLMVALHFDGYGDVQESSLKALYRLSSAFLSSGTQTELFANKMGRYADDHTDVAGKLMNVFEAVLNSMGQYQTNTSVQVYGNKLLWNIFPDAIQDPGHADFFAGKALCHIEAVMTSHQNSQAYHETIICLLSKMSGFETDSLGHEAFLSAAAEIMKAYPNSEIVALHGCRCLANACARSPTSSLSQPVIDDAIPAIISCMETFESHITIQSEACAALSAICVISPTFKKIVYQYDGISRIYRAYDCCSRYPYKDHCLAAKVRACMALNSLAADPIILSDIQNQGIMTKFERLLEEDSNIPAKLQYAIQGLLDLTSDTDNLAQNLEFREVASEDETCECLRANLRVVTSSPDFTPNRIVLSRADAIKAMQRFPTSICVHEIACKFLACLFALVSQCEYISVQDDIVSNELETITASLVQHKNNPTNAAAACSSLQNFCAMLCLSDSSDALGLNNVFSQAVTEVANCLVIHQEDEQNMVQGTGALQALCALREGLVLSIETNGTIGRIIGAANDFHNSVALQRQCIGILGIIFSVSDRIEDYFSDNLVNVILRFLKQEADNDDAIELVESAVNVIVAMINTGFQGVTILLRNEKLIDSIVDCMWTFPRNLPIQFTGIRILSSFALDNYLRGDVCQRGGTSRILIALDNLKQDPVLVGNAFAALANLINSADVEILHAPEAPAPALMCHAIKCHPENLTVQINGAAALWALSAKSDSFKDEIVNLGGAEVVAGAMTRFLGSKQMQLKGFVLIWSLGTPAHLKSRVGREAIEAVVSGLSAHFSSRKICEEAMGCLKCLALLPVNKIILEEHGGSDLIYSCMWLHSGNSTVSNAALCALCNMSVNVETNEVSEIMDGDLEAIVNAMRTHQTVRAIQENAIILLRNFTFSRTNIMVLEQNPFLVPLIRSAMSNFNDNFGNRADNLLCVLPALNQ